jgi:hypothetical protein
MSRSLVSIAIALALAACGAGQPRTTTEGWAWIPLHPRTHEPAIAALVLSHGMALPGEPESEDHPLAVAVWADGTLISSAAGHGEYGQPYRTANVGAEACEKIRSRIQQIMLEREGKLVSFGIIDSSSEELLVREGDRVWRMQSCIDLFESNPKLVAFSGGVAAREQMPPLDANDPREQALQEFREAWARAKQWLLSAVPDATADLEAQPLEFVALGSRRR